MWKDPVVEELRGIREALSKECHDDLGEIIANLQKRSRAAGRKTVRLPAKRLAKPATRARARRRKTA